MDPISSLPWTELLPQEHYSASFPITDKVGTCCALIHNFHKLPTVQKKMHDNNLEKLGNPSQWYNRLRCDPLC